MNRNFVFALVLVLAVVLTGCVGNVPTAPATSTPTVPEPTATLSPTATPTDLPTVTLEPTAVPTEVPSPTVAPSPTPISWVPLEEWAAANGFSPIWSPYPRGRSYVRVTGYYAIRFLVSEYDAAEERDLVVPFRVVTFQMNGSADQASQEEVRNMWIGYTSELLTPAIAQAAAEWIARPSHTSGLTEEATIDGYAVLFEFRNLTGGLVRYSILAVDVPPPPNFDSGVSFEQVEAIAGGDCLAVVTGDPGSEEMNSWTQKYIEELALEALGDARLLDSSEGFLLPSGCFVMIYHDPASGEDFLIYETANGVVKVPFSTP
ncbi:MAG: hypothetical protein WED08_03185 [Patescibacteria group bacterium]